ncbi:MAG: putative secreted protein containing plastocyanin domain [Verrucomicrobiaceae bacterium]|nr:putative secreted protein containing plastocyanin domain [Verrucomicrobiaceae bacterium]
MTLIVNGIGLLIIAAIIIWFWLWRARATQATTNAVDIVVANGVYKPDVIEMKRGTKLTLNFNREDPSPCAEQVIFHGLDISETLPVGKIKTIKLTPQHSGNYRFTCQMQMYQGTLKVVDA